MRNKEAILDKLRSFLKNTINIKNSIFNPAESYRFISGNTRILTIWIFCGLSITLLNYLINPFIIEGLRAFLRTKNFSSEYIEGIINIWMHTLKISHFVNPILLLLKWLIIALIFWLIFQLITKIKKFAYKKILSLVAHAELINLLSKTLSLIILYIKGIESIQGLKDVQSRFGLDLFIDTDSIFFERVLEQVNFFEIWWMIFLMGGFYHVLNISKKKAFFAVLFVWIFISILEIGYDLITLTYQKGYG